MQRQEAPRPEHIGIDAYEALDIDGAVWPQLHAISGTWGGFNRLEDGACDAHNDPTNSRGFASAVGRPMMRRWIKP